MSKRIAIALAVAAIIGIAAAAIVFGKGGEDGPGAEDPVTRGEWVEMLGSGFGIDEHSGEQPYFDDVVESSELFAYAQSCAEWGVLEPGGSLLPDEPATRLFVARTALAAAEVDWSGYGQGSDGGGALECAFELGVVARGQADDPMTQMACDQALDVALSLFCAPSEGYADITLKASVADLSEVEGIAAGEGFVEGSSSALGGVEQGDVIVVMQDGGPTAHKVEHVGEAGGSVRLGTSTPEIGETFETFDFSVTAYVGRDDIEPLTDGVSVSEVRTAQAGYAPGSANIITAAGSKGSPLEFELEIDLSEGELSPKVSPFAGVEVSASEVAREFFGAEVYDYEAEERADEWAKVLEAHDMAFAWNEDGTLTFKKKKGAWADAGASVKGRVKVSDLYLDASCKGADLDSLSMTLHYNLEGELEMEGEFEGQVALWRGYVTLPYGLTASITFSLYCDADGGLSVEGEVEHVTKVKRVDGRFKKTQDTDSTQSVNLDGEVEAGVQGDALLRALGIPVVDGEFRVGAGAEAEMVPHASQREAMACLDVVGYAPLVTLSLGTDSRTLAHKVGVEEKFRISGKAEDRPLVTVRPHDLLHLELTEAGLDAVEECTWVEPTEEESDAAAPAAGSAQTADSLVVGVRPFDLATDVDAPVLYEHRYLEPGDESVLYTIYVEGDSGGSQPVGTVSLPYSADDGGEYVVQPIGNNGSSWAFSLQGPFYSLGLAFVYDCESAKFTVLSDDRAYNWYECGSCLAGIGFSFTMREATPVRVCNWGGSVLYERIDTASAVFDESEGAVYFVTYAGESLSDSTALVWVHTPGSEDYEQLCSIGLPEDGPHVAWISIGEQGKFVYVGYDEWVVDLEDPHDVVL